MRNVQETKSVASAELLNSYRYEIRKATIQQTALALFYFQEKGRFLDMKNINRLKRIPVKEIVSWIKDVGLSAFKTLPTKNRTPAGQNKILNQLAWGIVRSKRKKKHLRRNLQKGWGKSLGKLVSELSVGFKDRTAQQIIQSITST